MSDQIEGVCYGIGELLIFDLQKISALFQSYLGANSLKN